MDDVRRELVEHAAKEPSLLPVQREVVMPRRRRHVPHARSGDLGLARALRLRNEGDDVHLEAVERREALHEVHERGLDSAPDETWIGRVRPDERDTHAPEDYLHCLPFGLVEALLRRGLRGSFWPSGLQERLLAVALGNAGETAQAWSEIRPRFVLDELEPGSFELMPLVYSRLAATVGDEPLLGRLKGVYRREWVRSSVLAERTKEVASALGGASVDALFVEGAVLAARYYASPALRTSWSLDALVRPEDADRALETLTDAGWSAPPPTGAPRDRWALTSDDRTVCILRTAPAYDFAGAPLWDGAESYDLGGTVLRAPQPTHTLLAVCAAGARVQEPRTLTWLVDAAMIVRSGAVDWTRLVSLARAHTQVLRLRDALTYLARLPGVDVPEEAVRELSATRVPARERLVHALAAGAFNSAGALPELAARHLVATADASALDAARSFPARLRAEWGTQRGWHLPAAVARRVLRRLRLLLA